MKLKVFKKGMKKDRTEEYRESEDRSEEFKETSYQFTGNREI